ncbi:MAG: ChaN family lipoprotein [Saprospiraceae bacterium]
MSKLKLYTIALVAIFLMSFILNNDKPVYIIYNSKGKEVSYKKMMKSLKKSDMVFFGELHNSPIAHWLQLEVTQDIFNHKKEKTVLGAEMFEADNQLILDEYLGDVISKKSFKNEARLWPNYKTDYEPLVEMAKKNKLPFIATNIPRRYASLVFKKGIETLESLTDEAKSYIAPLPIKVDLELNCYKSMMEMMRGKGNSNFPKAQAIKDATMAHFILKNWTKGQTFVHYNGSFHSDNHEGIVWYINQQKKDLDIKTISVIEQDDISKLSKDSEGVADFIICVPTNMTKTH